MVDDIRNHDPRPTEHEREWMASSAFGLVARVVLATGVSLMIGVSASALVERYSSPTVASSVATMKSGSPVSSR